MVRGRWIALALMAALVAPWAAPCLVAAPSDDAMPCCVRSHSPVNIKPCCAPEDQQPATQAGTATIAALGSTVATLAAPFARTVLIASIRPSDDRVRSLDVRSLSTVLLI